jgi:hypothetical protein
MTAIRHAELDHTGAFPTIRYHSRLDAAAVLRAATTDIAWRPVTSVLPTAPTLVVAPAHGVLPHWSVSIVDASGGALAHEQVMIHDADTLVFPHVDADYLARHLPDLRLAYAVPLVFPEDVDTFATRLVWRDAAGADSARAITGHVARPYASPPSVSGSRVSFRPNIASFMVWLDRDDVSRLPEINPSGDIRLDIFHPADADARQTPIFYLYFTRGDA